MATTVTSAERVTSKGIGTGTGGPRNGKGWPGNGSRGNGGGGRRGDDADYGFTPARYRLAMWVALAAISMMFVALTSAYIVRSVSPEGVNDWRPIAIPRLIWLSTALIAISSITFEVARKTLRRGLDRAYIRWLLLTVLLGFGFLASQLLAWRQLKAQGIYLASNAHSSFFYVLTGAHGVHLLGGILALGYLLLRTWRKRSERLAEVKRQATADAVAIYWHFMDGLWIYLFLLLFFWR